MPEYPSKCGPDGETPTQRTSFGDQTVGEQKNDADVNHEQNNVNVLSPPVALGILGNAEAENEQTNINYSKTFIKQENEVEQKQSADQRQSVVDLCKGLVYRP